MILQQNTICLDKEGLNMALHGDTKIKVFQNNQWELIPIRELAGTKPIILDARGIHSRGFCYKLPDKMECLKINIWREQFNDDLWERYIQNESITMTPSHQIYSFLEFSHHEELVLYYQNQTFETINPRIKLSSDFRYVFCNEYAIELVKIENAGVIHGKTTSPEINWLLGDDLWQINSTEPIEESDVFTIKTLTNSFDTEFIHVHSY